MKTYPLLIYNFDISYNNEQIILVYMVMLQSFDFGPLLLRLVFRPCAQRSAGSVKCGLGDVRPVYVQDPKTLILRVDSLFKHLKSRVCTSISSPSVLNPQSRVIDSSKRVLCLVCSFLVDFSVFQEVVAWCKVVVQGKAGGSELLATFLAH